MDRIKKIAKDLDAAAKAFFWVFLVLMGLAVIAAVICIFSSEDAFSAMGTSLMLEPVRLELAGDGPVEASVIKLRIIIGFFVSAVLFAAISLVMKFLRRIFIPMTEGHPFDGAVSRTLRQLSIIVLVGGILLELGGAIFNGYLFQSYSLESLFNMDAIAGYTIEYRCNLTFLIMFVVLRLLSFVFHYGEQLQRESDETL